MLEEGMTSIAEILTGALEMPRTDRSYLATKLIESLDEEVELTPEYRAELDGRMESYRKGESKAVSSDDLHSEIRALLQR